MRMTPAPGYIVQLPLPAGVDTNAILERVDPDKDADGLHPHQTWGAGVAGLGAH